MIATILLNHDPHVIDDDLEIVRGYCGEWNSLYSGLEPKKLLDHRKVVGPGLCAEGKAQRVITYKRAKSWVVLHVKNNVEYNSQPIPVEKGKH